MENKNLLYVNYDIHINNPILVSGVPEYIFACGLARSGKDLLFKLLKETFNNNIVQISLANKLKEELQPVVKSLYNIDIYNCSNEEKELIRPLMVFHGGFWRKQSKGTHWTKILDNLLKEEPYNNSRIIKYCSDVRYKEYAYDELDWAQKKNGVIIHITKYKVENNNIVFFEPPNNDEKFNDPILKKNADIHIYWRDFGSYEVAMSKMGEIVNELLDKF